MEATSNHNALYIRIQMTQQIRILRRWCYKCYTNEGVPVDKLVLGVPFYGRGWKSCGKENNGQYQPCKPGSDGKLASKGTWDDYSTGDTGVYDYGDLATNYVNKMVLYATGMTQLKYLTYIMQLQAHLLATMTMNL